MKQLKISPEKCIDCRTCELVCSFGHYQVFNPKLANVNVLFYEEAAIAVPVMCRQCEEASCQAVCPVGAISRNEIGAVVMNYDKCIGCKMCMNACPLGNISFSSKLKKVFKCDLCDGDPKCAKYCPGGAIVFEEEDRLSQRKKLVAEKFRDVFGEEAQA